MNRIYKVIWNEALSCFTAVGEYAKGRAKSSKPSVSANASVNTTSNLSSIRTIRLSAIGLGLLAAGFGMHANAEISYSNTMHLMGHQSSGNGYGHESHGNGNGYGHNNNGNNNYNGNGLKFDGDTGKTVKRSHGQTLTIKGGEANKKKLSNGDNIGVVADGKDTLTIKLAKNLTDLDSAAFNNGVVISSTGINAGNKVVSGVAGGVDGNDAVNLNQLTNTVAANRTKYYSVDSTASGNANNDGATGYNAMAMGGNAKATGSQTIAIGSSESGQQTLASGEQSIAIGANVVSRGGSSIAIGGDDLNLASIYNLDGTITDTTLNSGTVNSAFNEYAGRDLLDLNDPYTGHTESGGAASIAIGVKARTEGHLATAMGTHASASETASSAFGVASSATEKGALALGAGAQSATQNGVALGSKSIANVAGGATGFVPIGTLLIDENAIIATKSVTLGAVSVGTGSEGGNRQIVNVAAGTNNSDAVNVAQLTGLQNGINNEIAKGIKIGDGNSDNDQQFALGDTINVTGDSNLTTVVSETGVQVKLNNQLDLGDVGSMQIGNSIMNNGGVSFLGGSTVRLSSSGLNNGGNRITNVADGSALDDAVNVSQLNAVTATANQGWDISAQGNSNTVSNVGPSDTVDFNSKNGNIVVTKEVTSNDVSFELNNNLDLNSVTTGDTTMNDNGLTIEGGPSITKNGIDAADNKITNVQNGEVSAESQDAVNGSQLYAQGIGISSIIGGDTVYNSESGTFTNSNIGGTGEGNIDGAIASIRQGTIEINENVQVNTTNIATNTTNISTNTTNIATNTSNITTNTTNIATNTSNITTNTNDIAINTSNIMTNTTNIKTNTDKLDAGLNFGADSGANINKSVGDGSVLSFTGGNNITTTAEGSSIKFDLNGNISVDSVTVGTTVINSSGISMQDGPSMTALGLYAGNQRITGVADGVEATDAVNYSQLSELDSRLNNNMSDLGYKIGEVEENANAGISAAMAMSSLPQAYIAGKSMISGGVGTYNGESAVAVGFSKLSNDGRWVMKINGTADTQGNAGGAIGAGFHFD
ncbi:YadA-like family protein [Psychrobacter sp. NG25]|uniref:YadA-like family protein n=1 Tax=Psychrobacter sp. NG25 TaxID=2782005 RepID=UPI00188350B3|nr:YadA-like family protein [Psychrobacter sp. NG25]MBF0659020.1 YadA-like family protein [Psychrobacter sp. NG25]